MTFARWRVAVGALLFVATMARADATPAPRAKHATKPRVHARASSAGTEAARREREQREDLKRRVERLEQRYEMQQPAMPPPDSAAPRDR